MLNINWTKSPITAVRAYRNLNNGRISLQGTDNLVHGYCDAVTLTGVTFKASPAAVARVLAGGKREVCMYACGNIAADVTDTTHWVPIYCNPKKFATFVIFDTHRPITRAAALRVTSDGRMLALQPC